MVFIIWSDCSANDLPGYASQYGATFPFMADDWSFESQFGQDNYIPSFFIIAPGLEMVVSDSSGAQGQIGNYLP